MLARRGRSLKECWLLQDGFIVPWRCRDSVGWYFSRRLEGLSNLSCRCSVRKFWLFPGDKGGNKSKRAICKMQVKNIFFQKIFPWTSPYRKNGLVKQTDWNQKLPVPQNKFFKRMEEINFEGTQISFLCRRPRGPLPWPALPQRNFFWAQIFFFKNLHL